MASPSDWHAVAGWNVIGAAYTETTEGREALRGAHALASRARATLRVVTAARADAVQRSLATLERAVLVETIMCHRVASDAHCPVIVPPRGAESPLWAAGLEAAGAGA
jgi:hypothetical protein